MIKQTQISIKPKYCSSVHRKLGLWKEERHRECQMFYCITTSYVCRFCKNKWSETRSTWDKNQFTLDWCDPSAKSIKASDIFTSIPIEVLKELYEE